MNCKGKCCRILVCSSKLHVSCKSGRLKQAPFLSLGASPRNFPAHYLHRTCTLLRCPLILRKLESWIQGAHRTSPAKLLLNPLNLLKFFEVYYIYRLGEIFLGWGVLYLFFWNNAWSLIFLKKNKTRTSWKSYPQTLPYLCHNFMVLFELFLNRTKQEHIPTLKYNLKSYPQVL